MSKKQQIQPDNVSYVDTQLIECSRLQSVEYSPNSSGKNKAIFTNRQSHGIQIEEGDVVSLNSAFVSEVGAGGEVIEFTGKENGDTYTVEYTHTSGDVELPTISGLLVNDPYQIEDYAMPYLPSNKYLFRDFITEVRTETFPIKDNEINFTTGVYKTTNGEGYFHLPRRFVHAANFKQIQQFYQYGTLSASDAQSRVSQQYQNRTWRPADTLARWNFELSGQILRGATNDFFDWQTRCQADFQLQPFVPESISQATTQPYFIKKNDNTRYKLFRRDQTRWYGQTNATAVYKTLLEDKHDIALQPYIEVKQLQKVTTDVGFDTPSNIATNITEQLSKKQSERDYNVLVENASGAAQSPHRSLLKIGELYETALFKPYEAATEQMFNETASRRFFAGVNSSGVSSNSETLMYNQSTLDFYNCFHHICVKRPEVFKTQRLLYDASQTEFEVLVDIDLPPATTDEPLVTNIRWTAVNPVTTNLYLDDFRNAFDAEELYPELFDYSYTPGTEPVQYIDVTDLRLIHIASASNASHLGCDNMLFTGDVAVNDATNISGSESLPVFINFKADQKNNRNIDDGANIDNLWGGFALRYRHTDGEDYIAFTCDHLFRHAIGLFDGDDQIKAGRKVGFDRHFSAYGTACIGLYNGKTIQCYTDPEDQQMFTTGSNQSASNILIRAQMDTIIDLGGRAYFTGLDQFPYLYMGSPEPLVNFDTSLNRFTISDLYSPEFVGNFAQAGDTFPDNPYTLSTNPETKVYFVNKRLRQNSFCPDMVPYNNTRFIDPERSGYPAGTFTKRSYLAFNQNLSPYTIYDSHSGIIWNNFGTDRDNWENNSIFGILGFDYDVFHPSNPTNFQTRYSFSTQNPTTDGLLTNVEETSKDILGLPQNAVQAPFFNYQVPGPAFANFGAYPIGSTSNEQFIGDLLLNVDNIPPIVVEDASSIQIRATNLPKKTTRPYYLIRSNIIQQNNFMDASGAILPVIGLVNKINGYADFYSTESEGVEFTATKSYVISDITTSIHNPDGSLATVDDNSSVIYKVKKNKQLTTNLADIVLQM
jgi:hypothetical protein|tara:strand:- start:1147 stop:4290 length:3144 start_codon:yes stop_codon:yes gene_type:complete